MKKSRQRWRSGDIVEIGLGNEQLAYGRVLREPLMAFYDYHSPNRPEIEDIVGHPFAFKVFVMKYAVSDGDWPVIGWLPLDGNLLEEPWFFKRDPLTKKLSIYRDTTGEEIPATPEECASLECAAVWEPEHVVDRLRDHFANRPNKWVESMRAGP